MPFTTLGNLATHSMLLGHNSRLRQDINDLTTALGSGRVADPVAHLDGDLAVLADITTRWDANSMYRKTTNEAELLARNMESVLGHVQDIAGKAAQEITNRIGDIGAGDLQQTSLAARSAFEQMVAALNTQLAGQSILSGNHGDRPSLIDADSFLSALKASLATASDAPSFSALAQAWFDDPSGGFQSLAYQGSPQHRSPIAIAEGETVQLNIRADDDAIKAILKPLAIAALAADPGFSLPQTARETLVEEAAIDLHSAQADLTQLRAGIGIISSRLEENRARLSAEQTALEHTQNDLLSVDPYEAATRLEQTRINLESLYSVTARLSRISLTEYLR